ncbi:hypothetical protein [Devosia sp.]|uniref:hypothetical protein n=1 Tax=Devosia sp. TaxID=1871048 RepID=UPI00261D7980|nr:hypothetical protein [Devosia sp.]
MIVLFELCQRLSDLGATARIWPSAKPVGFGIGTWRAWASYIRRKRWQNPKGVGNASRRHLATAVVIYPEIVPGNPLGASRVVRWLLYKPGAHTGVVDFGEDEATFCYNPAFNDAGLNPEGRILRVSSTIPDYRQTNFGERSGAALIIRKGSMRELNAHPPDAVNVDEMSHAERAKIFNRVERLYCYDPHTYYAIYAALCGCVPIVIPEPGVSEEVWEPDPRMRLGLAYGEDRVDWALESRSALLDHLAQARAEEDVAVREFIRCCRERFRR